MKKIIITFFILIWTFSFLGINNSYSDNSKYLDNLTDNQDIKVDKDWSGEEGIQYLANRIAKSLQAIFFAIATIYFLIISIKLIITNKTEEEISNFKKWILWISIWLILTQLASAFVNNIYQWKDTEISFNEGSTFDVIDLATNLKDNIINPLIQILETAAAFFFVIIAIYAFFRIITSAWDEEKAKTWKMTVLYAIIWFIVIKLARFLINAVYKMNGTSSITGWVSNISNDLSWVWEIIFNIINWMNSFVWLFVIIMILFTWAKIIFSWWDEDKLSKAKKSIIYIVIWIAIILMNYLILMFFFNVNPS